MSARGSCMCGEVGISLPALPATYQACACDMCRQITGGMFYSVWVSDADLTLTGKDAVREHDSSPWAARGFCGTCGSVLWYRPKGGDARGLSLGLLEDAGHLGAGDLYYADKPVCTQLRQTPTNPMSEAETIAHFTGDDA